MPLSRKQRLLFIFLVIKMAKKRKKERKKSRFQALLQTSEMANTYFLTYMQTMTGFSQLISLGLRSPRSCRAYDRQEFWFQDLWTHRFDETYQGGGRWKRDFRMKAETFTSLVNILTPYLQKEDTVSHSNFPRGSNHI